MVFVKNWQFFYLFNIGKIGQEILFENIVARQKTFPDYKNKRLKSGKIGIFPRGLVHGFGQKLVIFPSF